MNAVPQSSLSWHTGFLNMMPAVVTHAKIKFRKLRAERREEAIQEAIASAYLSYQILAAKGKLDVAHASTLGSYAVNFVRSGRHVGGRQDAAKDVMSPVCRERHGVAVVSYHATATDSGTGTGGWRQIAIAEHNVPIPDTAAFRIDFAEWLRTLSRRDRKIICAFVSGERTQVVAERFGISEGRVSQLRRKYEREWRVFQGEPTPCVNAA